MRLARPFLRSPSSSCRRKPLHTVVSVREGDTRWLQRLF